MRGWFCAQSIHEEESKVLPGFVVCKGYDWIQVGESMSPPDWCEKPLEHIVTKPGQEVKLVQDSRIVEFNGNNQAEQREMYGPKWKETQEKARKNHPAPDVWWHPKAIMTPKVV